MMQTDDLVGDLVARLAAEAPAAPLRPWRMAGQMLAAVAVAAGLFLALAGARPGLAAALAQPVVLAKTLLPAGLALLALPLALRTARPGAAAPLALLALPLLAALGLGIGGLATLPAGARLAGYTPAFVAECLGLILLIAALPLALALHLLRRGASTRPGLTGALAGLAVAGGAAAGYSFFCIQDNPLFYLVWYGTAIGLAALAGGLAGRRLLRW